MGLWCKVFVAFVLLAMADARANKLRKLNEFRRKLPWMSAVALSSMVDEIKKGAPLPDLHQRKHVQEATAQPMPDTIYGPVLESIELLSKTGQAKEFLVVNLITLLQNLYFQGGGYYTLIKDTMARCPSTCDSPWSLCIYADEVTPGQALGIHQGRKIWCIYVSVLNFGGVHLCQELAWLPICICRTSQLEPIAAGISQLFAGLLKHIFNHPKCKASAGIFLKGKEEGDYCAIYLQMGCFLQDGQAMKMTWNCKGNGAHRLCMCCANLYSEKSNLAAAHNEICSDLLAWHGLVFLFRQRCL